jgi:hypothetical protein
MIAQANKNVDRAHRFVGTGPIVGLSLDLSEGELKRFADSVRLRDEPSLYRCDNVVLLFWSKLPPGRDAMPFLEAAPATCRSCMLSDEDRMSLERSLLSVVCRKSRGEPTENEVASMFDYNEHSFGVEIRALLWPE